MKHRIGVALQQDQLVADSGFARCAEVIDVSKLLGDTIKFGQTVTLTEENAGAKKVWQIVGEPEADAHKGNISVTSPIARIGKTRGETVEVETPGGSKVYRVLKVECGAPNKSFNYERSNWHIGRS